jgi:MoxR-like ATPase
VLDLEHSIELIQGPPGTGKSTLIAAVANCRVPEGCAIRVVATRNQAVDSVVEKLGKILG